MTARKKARVQIGIDVTSALTQGGGIGRYTRELVRALLQVDQAYDYRFFSAKPPVTLPVPNPLPTAKNASHYPAPLDERWLYRLWYRLRLPLPVQWVTGSLTLFHSPDFVLPPVWGNIPTLLTVHDLSFVHTPENFPPPLVAYLNRVVPWSIQRATHLLVDSKATQRDLETLWQVPAAKMTLLYCGVGAAFRPQTNSAQLTAVRAKYGLGERPFLLSVGTIQPRKNYQMLIRAFAPIAAAWPHNLIIAGGKGWLFDDMLAEVERQGLAERVHFIGFVDEGDLPALYSLATLFCFPSIYEGFGLPLLEGMACGVPVISSNAASLPEVVGAAGLLLSPDVEEAWTEAIANLLADDARRAQLVAAGFRQARKFSWESAAKQLLQTYKKLLKQE